MFNVWQMNSTEKRLTIFINEPDHFLTFRVWSGCEKAESAFNNSLVSRSW